MIVALENVSGITRALALVDDQLQLSTLQGKSLTAQQISRLHESDMDFISLLENWLQYYGPVSIQFIQTSLGIDSNNLVMGLTSLVDTGSLIVGELIKESTEILYCDSGNFESLLRLSRQLAVPQFEPRDLSTLPGFLHHWQQVDVTSQDPLDQLFAGIDQLRCYPATAHLWETEYLPARVANYDQSQIDLLYQNGDLYWIGGAKEKIMFCFTEDLDLLDQQTADNSLTELFPDIHGRYDLSTLMDRSGTSADKVSELLWSKVWQGTVTNDSFMSLRKGIENNFTVPAMTDLVSQRSNRRSLRRGSFSRWKNAVPFSGNWYKINYPATDDDLLVKEEHNKERSRLLLDRYGILFRELLHKEAPEFQWPLLFRTLRLMELSGEVLAGYFFKNIPGPQFISHTAFRLLQKDHFDKSIYWLNATDPISLAGVQLPELKDNLPRRIESNHLVYQGSVLVLVSERNGRRLTINRPADDPEILNYFVSLKHMLYRSYNPLNQIRIELINGAPARSSDYLNPLGAAFDLQADHKEVTLRRSYLHD
jgi:ATP-dependent Lhr-like helicase